MTNPIRAGKGQAAILRFLHRQGGAANYLHMCLHLKSPDVKLVDYAALEREGYITHSWPHGEYALTPNGLDYMRSADV